jgi:8-oxo-(d)GTP phosphatase
VIGTSPHNLTPQGQKMLLHRHASAGEKLDSPSLDRMRPLDRAGRVDARLLPRALADFEIDRILSSSHRRCLDTVRPLTRSRGLLLERSEELAPDAPLEDTKALLEELPDTALVCTHREVFERLFGGVIECEKGGTWIVERRGSRLVPTEYLPPPTQLLRVPRSAVAVGRLR